MLKYVAGNIIENTAMFTADDNTTPIDPSFVVVKYWVYGPSLSGPYSIQYVSATTPATGIIAKIATGTYVVRLDTSLLPGYWQYEWFGSGAGQATLPLSAIVYQAPFYAL